MDGWGGPETEGGEEKHHCFSVFSEGGNGASSYATPSYVWHGTVVTFANFVFKKAERPALWQKKEGIIFPTSAFGDSPTCFSFLPIPPGPDVVVVGSRHVSRTLWLPPPLTKEERRRRRRRWGLFSCSTHIYCTVHERAKVRRYLHRQKTSIFSPALGEKRALSLYRCLLDAP